MRRRIPLTVRRRVAGELDRYRQPTYTYEDEVVRVYAVSPRQSVEPDEDGRRAVISGLQVLAHVDLDIGPHDRVLYDGEVWEVEGRPAEYKDSPVRVGLNLQGKVFNLERSTG